MSKESLLKAANHRVAAAVFPNAHIALTSNSSSSSRAPSWGSFFFSSWGLVSFSTFFSLLSAIVGEVADGTMSRGVQGVGS